MSTRRPRGPRNPRLPAHLLPIIVQADRPTCPLTREQAAELFEVHPRTVDRWVRRGRLFAIDLGGTIRIPATEAARIKPISAWTRFD
jgi:excisionase family DNA binding protein